MQGENSGAKVLAFKWSNLPGGGGGMDDEVDAMTSLGTATWDVEAHWITSSDFDVDAAVSFEAYKNHSRVKSKNERKSNNYHSDSPLPQSLLFFRIHIILRLLHFESASILKKK